MVKVPDSPELQLTEEFTLEAWVRPTSDAVNGALVSKLTENFTSYDLYAANYPSPGKPAGGASPEPFAGPEVEASEPLAPHVWAHLALTYDGAKLRLYVEGELVDTKEGVDPMASEGPLEIGGATVFGDYLDGKIDEVRLYNRALAQGEVQSDAATPLEAEQVDPIAAYSFDEGEGTVAHDASGNGQEGTIEGAEWVRGKYGSALDFDGTESCLTVPDSPQLQLDGAFTLEAWVRPDAARQYSPLFFKQNGETHSYAFWMGQVYAGKPVGEIITGNTPESEVLDSEALASKIWSHVALINDGEHQRIYVNGELVATGPGGSAVDSEGPLTIGCGKPYSDYFEGRIDEVRIYNRALSAAEVQADLAAPIQTPPQGPVAAYGFNEGEGTSAEDLSGNEHEATIEGAEWANGKYGDALKFDGTSSCVSIVDAADLRLGEEFTLESWVKPEGTAQHDPVIFKEAEGFPSYGLGAGLLHNERPEGTIGTSGGGRANHAAGGPLEVNIWSHVAVTYDGPS